MKGCDRVSFCSSAAHDVTLFHLSAKPVVVTETVFAISCAYLQTESKGILIDEQNCSKTGVGFCDQEYVI